MIKLSVLKNLSIRHKIPLMVILPAFAIWFAIFGVMVIKERSALLEVVENNIKAQVVVLGANSIAAILFDDNKTANEILSSMTTSPNVVAAVLYGKDNVLFAAYSKKSAGVEDAVESSLKEGTYYSGNILSVSRDIFFEGKHIGRVIVSTDLEDVNGTLKRHALYTAAIMAVTFIGFLGLYAGLHVMIVVPLTRLRNIMHDISRFKDYSIRVFKHSNDEIGSVVDGFNDLLAQTHKHINEKNRFFQDLHDGLGGIITNINMLANMAQDAASDADSRKMLATISELSKEGLSEIRTIIQTLDYSKTDWQTLAADMNRYGSQLIESHGIRFEMTSLIDNVEGQPDVLVILNLLKIYKEALNNTVKHAKAEHVRVLFEINEKRLMLCVGDDGVGIKEGGAKGHGIPNMRARTEEMGGSLTITSDNGMCVKLEVPMP